MAGRTRAEGTASLESAEVVFRSPSLRLRIPLKDIRTVDERDGRLTLTYDRRRASFDLGPKAAAWANRIRNPRSLIDKLGVKPEHRVVLIGIRNETVTADVRARASDTSSRLRKHADVVLFGAGSLRELARLRTLRDYINPAGMIWTVTPKGRDGIRDTEVLAAGRAAGLVDIKVVAVSATHTATKFVIPRAQRA